MKLYCVNSRGKAFALGQSNKEMDKFLDRFNNDNSPDPVPKAVVAHFCFIIIHLFDDGIGRIGRAITDMSLARSEGSGERFYSMSSQIPAERKRYYFWILNFNDCRI